MVRDSHNIGDAPRSIPSEAGLPNGQVHDQEVDLWRRFAEATDLKTFCQSWLSLQCSMFKGVRSAMVLLGTPDRGPFTPVAIWPTPDFNVTHLSTSAERALRERRGLLLKNESSSKQEDEASESLQISYPVEVSGKIHGVVVLEVSERPSNEVQVIMRQLHWGSAWLEVLFLRADELKAEETNEGLRASLDLIASVVEQERFQSGAMSFVTRLATKLDCERVSLGFLHRKKLRVSALSHSSEFGKQMNLVRAISSAMEEAIDQRAVIVYPLPQDVTPLVTRSHEELSRQHGAGSILTVTLKKEDKFFGCLTLERPKNKPFDQEEVEFCETVASLVGPIFDAKRNEERWLITKAGESFSKQLKKFIGPGHIALKLISILIIGIIVFFYFAKGDYRVSAPTTLEGTIQRAICAPFDGFISDARVRPGDIAKEGDTLCLLDERDLKLERLKWVSQKEQLLKQHREAMAKHDRPEILIIQAKIEQADAQISLLNEQLARAKVTAPFDGVIMKGDLSQQLGAPVEKGQVLFEIAPLDSYRVIVEVDERDISNIAVGQRGELVLSSMPHDVFSLTIEKITPVSIAKEGRNYFRVEARLEGKTERLRPGMEGVGKVMVDRRKLIWIWTHELIDWLRLKLWAWWP